MKLTKEQISKWFSNSDYQKGYRYYNEDRVHTVSYTNAAEQIDYDATVEGTLDSYDVTIILKPNQLRAGCTCPWFAATHSCKHLVAALLKISEENNRSAKKTGSDRYARKLLEAYQSRSLRTAPPSQPARLVPRLTIPDYGRDYPILTFQVGYEKLYVVKNVHDFLAAFEEKRTEAYGKGLQLRHALEDFDPTSQQMIRLLMNEYDDLKSFQNPYYYREPYRRTAKANEVLLTGGAFDQFFDLFLGRSLANAKASWNFVLTEADPDILLALEEEGELALLRIPALDELHFFGYSQRLYAVSGQYILRCSSAFQERVYPMIQNGSSEMKMTLSDLSVFCSVVLPELRGLIRFEDHSNLLSRYLPDECTCCFYFDWENDHLVGRLKFRYGEIEVGENQTISPDIRRDLRTEQEAHALLTTLLPYDEETHTYDLYHEERIFDFLTDSIQRLQSAGEVYLSQRLQNKQIRPIPSTVGVSVSNGILNLDINTGEFPLEELEALYSSLMQRRKYHRLKDGRFLALNGSSYETLAEMAHMTQLSPKELQDGHFSLPLYRGLYLDSVLKQDETLSIQRDQEYRSMIRSFKTVADSDYAVPETLRHVLRPYQKTGFRWLKTLESCHFGGILADEMGLGKTAQVIAFLQTASRVVTKLPSLIVCPSSLILNWSEEFQRFAPSLHVTLMMGAAKERHLLMEENWEDTDVFVTSYDLLKRDIDLYAEKNFYCCVLDEGQYIKNQSTQGSKAVKRIHALQRFVLTGTPIENRLSELWNLFDFLMPGYLYTHSRFVEKLEKPIVKSGEESASKQLSRLIQPFLMRRLKKDVLKELPDKVEHIRKIPMSDEERKTYLASAAAAKQELLSGEGGKFQILAALTRLRQLCCDPHLCYENYDGPSSKLDACLELCSGMAENGHQILLFSQFTSMLDRIRERLEEINLTSFTLQGSTPKQQRAELVRRFNAGEAQVFLISLKAGGTGLNLTAADVVIHFDPWWNIAAQNQATDRAHRIGQRSCVQVYKLIAKNSIEEKILELQEQKAVLMEAVSGNGESILSMSQDDLLELLG